MFDALDLAKYIVTKCINDGHPISNLQLHKTPFYSQKDYLQQGGPAFGERIEAWPYGPVVPRVYNKFCGSGAMPIRMKYPEVKFGQAMEKVDAIVVEKRSMNPWKLVEETHRPGGAWYRTYNNGAGRGHEILRDLIKECG